MSATAGGDKDTDGGTRVVASPAMLRRRRQFATPALQRAFARHVRAAQDAFLRGDSAAAERAAVLALRIKPTAHLFALLAVVAESRGQFERASDLRLLQAFLARDATLWRELLHECLTQQRYYKSVVCLQRLSALERHDAVRYRTLQLQLADLLVGLGEVRRAANVLVPLWNSSRCRDFEVFALLSSLYFQLGKWSSLQRLIESSLRYAFHVTLRSGGDDDDNGKYDNDNNNKKHDEHDKDSQDATARRHRVSKRVRFFGVDDDDDKTTTDDTQASPAQTQRRIDHHNHHNNHHNNHNHNDHNDDDDDDDFAMDATEQRMRRGNTTSDTTSDTLAGPAASLHIRNLYGEQLRLHTAAARRGFLTLVNVHAELLNEEGKFDETVRLVHYAAACVQQPLLQLPADLLVRLGIAYAFRGDSEAACAALFRHLLDTCAMDAYGDVLLDAAVSLQKVGQHAQALEVFVTIARYYAFHAQRLAHELADAQQQQQQQQQQASSSLHVDGRVAVHTTSAADARVAALRDEQAALATVLSSAYTGQAECLYALHRLHSHDDNDNDDSDDDDASGGGGRIAACRAALQRALAAEPTHLRARLLLSQLLSREDGDVDGAVAALTPHAGEAALQRIVLGHALVLLLHRSHRYVEAIALGVTLFELILSSDDDGDAQSIAPGSAASRRSAAALLQQPTLTRASSAIVAPHTLLLSSSSSSSQAGSGGDDGRLSAMRSGGSGGLTSLSFALAASIRAGSSVVTQQQLAQRGRAALTTTVYGASAAASVAAGRTRRKDDDDNNTTASATDAECDASAIFRFHRKRPSRVRSAAAAAAAATTRAQQQQHDATMTTAATDDNDDDSAALRRRRVEAVTRMPADAFWTSGAHDDDDDDDKSKVVDADEHHNSDKTAVKQEQPPAASQTTAHDGGSVLAATTRGKRTRAASSRRTRTSRRRRDTGNNASASDDDARERDLAELERCYTKDDGDNGDDDHDNIDSTDNNNNSNNDNNDDGDKTDDFALPSLEEVSAQFADPAMAQLFLQASSHSPLDNNNNNNDNDGGGLVAASVAVDGVAHDSPLAARATAQDVLRALGRRAFMQLAVTVVECYSALGKFTEAKEFAGLTLARFTQRRRFRQMGSLLERPLRVALLRAALAARESEDAYRVGVRLLQEDTTTTAERVHVLELLHCVLGRCDDRSAIVYRLFLDGQCDVPLLVLLANRYYITRSYTRALNLYLLAHRHRPHDILLHLLIGFCYYLCSHQKRIGPREACVSAGTYYLSRYQRLLIAHDRRRTGEALYNTARALQYLRLHYLAIPLYEHMCTALRVPHECSAALRHAAQVNLYFTYRWTSGNRHAALAALPHVS